MRLRYRSLLPVDFGKVPTADLHALHARVNAVLLQCVQEVFPSGRAPDNRVSAQVPFQLTAKHTWRLYAMLRRPEGCHRGGSASQMEAAHGFCTSLKGTQTTESRS